MMIWLVVNMVKNQAIMKKRKHIIPKNLILDIMSILVEILVLIGLVAVLVTTFQQVMTAISISAFEVVEISLENALLLVVFIELYLSIIDFFDGKGKSILYIIDATLSFVLREVIIQILQQGVIFTTIIALSVLIGVLALSRYIAVRECETNFNGRKSRQTKIYEIR